MTAKRGLGTAPAGSTVFGFGQPGTTDRVLKQPFLSADGQTIKNARGIDPFTRDYMLDGSGRSLGMTALQQQVYLATITTLGTSADTRMGSDVGNIKVVRKNTPTEIDAAVRKSLQPLTSAGKINIDKIDVVIDRGTVFIRIGWKDASGVLNTTTNFPVPTNAEVPLFVTPVAVFADILTESGEMILAESGEDILY